LKKSFVKGSLKVIATIAALTLIAGCSSSSTNSANAKACLALDTGGVDDKSFNASAWAGAEEAKELGADVKYLAATSDAD